MAAVVTLTTDFGSRDPWVGIMKGIILGVTPDVHLVDLTHDVAPYDVLEGALALEAAAPFFSAGTVHLAVVDPGVGGPRRGLVVATATQRFVGPDNGLFTPFFQIASWRAWELTAAQYRLPNMSRTFHGRDVFAPAAAYLALGVSPEQFGPEVRDPIRLAWPASRRLAEDLEGEVIHVDRFGNLITSIRGSELPPDPRVRIGGRDLPLVPTYGDMDRGVVAALVGSGGRLEIAVREGSAAAVLGVGRGAPVAVRTG